MRRIGPKQASKSFEIKLQSQDDGNSLWVCFGGQRAMMKAFVLRIKGVDSGQRASPISTKMFFSFALLLELSNQS
jgi:hypothetical protein